MKSEVRKHEDFVHQLEREQAEEHNGQKSLRRGKTNDKVTDKS